MIIKPDDYSKAEYVRKPAGAILLDDKEVANTLACVHCGAQWVPMPGSGKVRGFCMKCMGPI